MAKDEKSIRSAAIVLIDKNQIVYDSSEFKGLGSRKDG